jgi:aryl-alcohol dehydrogenase-like predicted oxidoreductase
MVHWPIDANSMAHFSGAHTAAGGRDYATTGNVKSDAVPAADAAFLELAALQKEGKIKHVGVSNFGVKQLEAALKTGVSLAVNQLCYNLIFRAPEFDIIPFCQTKGIGVLAYSPLMQGLLTGAWRSADEVPQYRARTRHFSGTRPKSRHGEDGHEDLLFKTLEALRAISVEADIPLHELALAYPLAQPAVTCVIAGATKAVQLEGNVKAIARAPLPAELLAKLNTATEELKQAMGKNCDLWQGLHKDGKNDGRIE